MLIAVLGILVAHFLKIWSSHRHLENHVHKHERPRSASASSATAPGVKRSFTASLPKPLQIRVTRLRLGQGLCYGLISGILSAHSLLVAKSAVELIVRTIVDRVNQFKPLPVVADTRRTTFLRFDAIVLPTPRAPTLQHQRTIPICVLRLQYYRHIRRPYLL